MYTYSVTPLDMANSKAIIDDLKYQYDNNITICPIFLVKLHPEGQPVIDKARIEGEKYSFFKKELDKLGVPSGILIQSSLGHKYVNLDKSDFTYITNLNNGQEETACCPTDSRFVQYLKEGVRHLATLAPKVIMLDDDFRLIRRIGQGCACKAHMEMFNKRTGLDMTREQLWDYISTNPHTDPLVVAFGNTQKDVVVSLAKELRAAIDEVDPTIQGINCTSGKECENVSDINKIFAGKNNPTIVRIPNGIYAPKTQRHFSKLFAKTEATYKKLKDDGIDIILAEMDTIPFNRYGKASSFMHSQFVMSLLCGCHGAKHWITRTTGFEPKSTKAYRKELAKNYGLYESLIKLAPKIKWSGVCIPYETAQLPSFKSSWAGMDTIFSEYVLERFGIPFYFSTEPGKINAISSATDYLSNDILDKVFENNLLITADCVEALSKRGYSKKIGVGVKERTDGKMVMEYISTGGVCGVQNNAKELYPLGDNTSAHSQVCYLKDGKEPVPLFAGVMMYDNAKNKVATFCGTPECEFEYSTGFSFLNESRKNQMIDIIDKMGGVDVYYDEDTELLLRCGYISQNELLVAVWNLGLDVLDNLPLVFKKDVKKAEFLDSDGNRQPVGFEKIEKTTAIDKQIRTMYPEVFIFTM